MIFCVEDERNIRELIVYTLNSSGFEGVGCADGEELFKQENLNEAEMFLLDIMLPGEDGFSILKKLKDNETLKDVPVIMITAKTAEYDKVKGLDLGADDYICKPFGMMEFLARVKAVLRRSVSQQKEEDTLVYKELTVKRKQHQVFMKDEIIDLTLKEYSLLEYLMLNEGIVMTRDQILSRIWGYEFDGETRTVDVHIRTLRQKLKAGGEYIETVRGVGYKIGGSDQ